MKILFYFATLLLAVGSKDGCNKTKTNPSTYKGRLEIKGICMNYTIKILAGDMDTSSIIDNWIDETTGKTYKNVFALGSRCTFPSTIQQGDEFLFTIDSSNVQNCNVCLAYYPVPSKHLSIKVIDK
jgi:hypothetical protein